MAADRDATPCQPPGEAWQWYVDSGALDAEVIHGSHELADHLHELASGCLADDPDVPLGASAGDAPSVAGQFERAQDYRRQAGQLAGYLTGRLAAMPAEMRPGAHEVLGRLSAAAREAGGRLALPGANPEMEAER